MNPGALVADGVLWVALPVAMLAGLVSFLSPCVLPLVPGYLGFIGGAVTSRPVPAAGQGSVPERGSVPELVEGSFDASTGSATGGGSASGAGTSTVTDAPTRSRLLLGVLLFIAGFTVVFIAVNVLGGVAGRFFVEYADLITRIMGVVVILLGLVFVGVFGIAQRTVRPALQGNLGLIGAPLLGLAMGIGWTPCIGPTLTAIFSVSWNLGDPWRAALLGLAYSLGLGIPFVLLTLGFGWATRSVAFLRTHIRVVNLIGGGLLVLLGVLMVTGVWTTLMAQLQGVVQSVPLPL